MKDWKIVSLEIEDYDKQIGDVFEHVWPKRTLRRKMKKIESVKADKLYKEIAGKFKGIHEKIITVYGNGNWHHYTSCLFKAAEKKFGNCSYWHFDNHTDWGYNESSEILDCASFVHYLTKHSLSHCTRAIGNNARYRIDVEETDKEIDYKAARYSIEKLIEGTAKQNYLSFDLDVMAKSEIITDFDRGNLKTGRLIEIIREIKEKKKIISADILGYAPEGKDFFDAKSLVLYLLIAGEILGEDIKEFGKLYYKLKEKNVDMKELLKCLK